MRNRNSSRAVIGEMGLLRNYGTDAVLHTHRRQVVGTISYITLGSQFVLKTIGPGKNISFRDGQILELHQRSGWRTYQIRYPQEN